MLEDWSALEAAAKELKLLDDNGVPVMAEARGQQMDKEAVAEALLGGGQLRPEQSSVIEALLGGGDVSVSFAHQCCCARRHTPAVKPPR